MENLPSIISTATLLQLRTRERVVLVDVRTGPGAEERYAATHLENAWHLNLDTDLADIKDDVTLGGRHPLPDPSLFAGLLESMGISDDTRVVLYDLQSGANAAARCWWMMRALGLHHVHVLDGGYQAGVRADYPVNAAIPVCVEKGHISTRKWLLPLATMEQVDRARQDAESLVVDVRDEARYRGEIEPYDAVAGHIPGAVNIPFGGNLDEAGLFLPPEVLYEKYRLALQGRAPENIIVHCGSGVTACHTILALDYAGMPLPALYVGSWSEWSRNGKPVATSGNSL